MVLDLTVKVKINHEEDNRIDFGFFEKQTKNPKVILADSVRSMSKKIDNPHSGGTKEAEKHKD